MKILFLDSYTCIYDTTTYLTSPLGGTQSAVSSLAKTLAAKGHEVAIINGTPEPKETDGVRFIALPCPNTVFNECDIIVSVSGAVAKTLRGVGCTKPLVLWTHHAANQPAVQGLQHPEERSHFAGMAFVSNWQLQTYIEQFRIAPEKAKVMRNAISPAFMNTQPSLRWLKEGKPPVLGYTSTPYRGLDILLLAFSSIRKKLDGATLRIFSSMKIYGDNTEDEYSTLYDTARNLPGVEYRGALPQPQLAQEMQDIDIWAYPSTFAETSCISAIEAMASGSLLISTSLGALPETTAGFAHLINIRPMQPIPGLAAAHFANHVTETATRFASDPQSAEALIAKQIAYAQDNHKWEDRAQEWIDWLETMV